MQVSRRREGRCCCGGVVDGAGCFGNVERRPAMRGFGRCLVSDREEAVQPGVRLGCWWCGGRSGMNCSPLRRDVASMKKWRGVRGEQVGWDLLTDNSGFPPALNYLPSPDRLTIPPLPTIHRFGSRRSNRSIENYYFAGLELLLLCRTSSHSHYSLLGFPSSSADFCENSHR